MNEDTNNNNKTNEQNILKTKVLNDEMDVNIFLGEIYNSIKTEHKDIKDLMSSITDMIDEDTDESMLGFIGPVLKDLLDVSVKNNEQYIKLAATIQKFLSIDNRISTKGSELTGDFINLTEEEKNQLKDIKKANNLINETKIDIENRLNAN